MGMCKCRHFDQMFRSPFEVCIHGLQLGTIVAFNSPPDTLETVVFDIHRNWLSLDITNVSSMRERLALHTFYVLFPRRSLAVFGYVFLASYTKKMWSQLLPNWGNVYPGAILLQSWDYLRRTLIVWFTYLLSLVRSFFRCLYRVIPSSMYSFRPSCLSVCMLLFKRLRIFR